MQQNWTLILRNKKKLFDFNFKELWSYRDLLFLLVRRDFVAYYKQTILGPIWFFIQPLFTMLIYLVVFSKIAKLSTDGMPPQLFYLTGIVCWNYFSECLNKTGNTFNNNSNILSKVYFPRLILPLSVIVSNFLTFCIQFFLLLIFTAYFVVEKKYAFGLSVEFLLLPFLVLHIALLGLGVGIIISSLTTKYKDLSFAVGFLVQLWMFATPIVYPMSQVPQKWLWLYKINPMAPIVQTFRSVYLNCGSISVEYYVQSLIITFALLFGGIVLFNRVEKSFMDTV